MVTQAETGFARSIRHSDADEAKHHQREGDAMDTCEHLPGYTKSLNCDGRTLWTSPDGFIVVRATGSRRIAPWCVHVNGRTLYATSLKDAAGVIARLPWRCPDCGNEMRFNHGGCKVTL